MSRSEITQAQWLAVVEYEPETDAGAGNGYPVYNVFWDECPPLVDELSAFGPGAFRLPTEAEWEHACRGGAQRVLRGGYWDHFAGGCRSASGSRGFPAFSSNTIDVRPAMDP